MATMTITVPDNAEEVFLAVNGRTLRSHIENRVIGWTNDGERKLLSYQAAKDKEVNLTAAISSKTVEREERELAAEEAPATEPA